MQKVLRIYQIVAFFMAMTNFIMGNFEAALGWQGILWGVICYAKLDRLEEKLEIK